MVETNKANTIEQLKERIHSGLEGISDEELSLLFNEAEIAAQSQNVIEETKPNEPQPSVAPVKVDTTPPVVEPSKGHAGLMDLMPDKFRDKDEAASLTKMVKALQELESENTRKSQELSQLSNVVQELSRTPIKREEFSPATPKSTTAAQPIVEEDVDDSVFFDKPTESTRKVFQQEFKRAIVDALREYDTFALRRDTLARFKLEHSDFDSLREEIVTVCRIHPEWDNDLNGLPKIYEAAKALSAAKKVTATPTAPAAPAVDIEKLTATIRAEVEASAVEKAKQAILAEITKRKAAAGIVSSSTSSTPQERITSQSNTTPLTEEEKMFKAMLDSGPKTLTDLGQYGNMLTLPKS